MFGRIRKGVKTKVLEVNTLITHKKGVRVVDPSQGKHMLGLFKQVEFFYKPVNYIIIFLFFYFLLLSVLNLNDNWAIILLPQTFRHLSGAYNKCTDTTSILYTSHRVVGGISICACMNPKMVERN